MVRSITLPAALAGVVLLAACGGSEANNDSASEDSAQRAAVHDESDVRAHIGLDESGFVTTPEGVECEAAVVMTNGNQVSMYADAGDVVATNPDGTAGVKVIAAEQATCLDFFTEALSTFPDGEPVFSENGATSSDPPETEDEENVGGVESSEPLTDLTPREVAALLNCTLDGEPAKKSESEYDCGPYYIVDWGTSDVSEEEMLSYADGFLGGGRGEVFIRVAPFILVYGSAADIAVAQAALPGSLE